MTITVLAALTCALVFLMWSWCASPVPAGGAGTMGETPRAVLLGAVVVSIVWFAYWPIASNITVTGSTRLAAATGAVAAAIALIPSLGWSPRIVSVGAVGLLIAAGAAVIAAGPPVIDVWVILRDCANGLPAGRNPYDMTFPDVPAGQTSTCFNYLPMTFLAAAPAQWVLGDVRWAGALCLGATVALLAWQARDRSSRLSVAILVGSLPGALYLVQQAWTELLMLPALVGAAVLVQHRRWTGAAVMLGLALATKQHIAVLLIPLAFWSGFGWRRIGVSCAVAGAVSAPWLLADPGRFVACTVNFFVDAVAPVTSQSLWLSLPAPIRTPVQLVALVLVITLVAVRCPRSGPGLLMGSGTVLAVFNLFNKQSFPNQWWFAAALVLAAFAIESAPRDATPPVIPRARPAPDSGQPAAAVESRLQ